MDLFVQLFLIFLLLVGAAYFAMAEISLAASRRTRLTSYAEKGDKRAQTVLNLKSNPGPFFSVVQIGINAVAILGGIVGEGAFTSLFAMLLKGIVPDEALGSVSFICSFSLITMIFVMFADLIPKRVAMSNPERVCMREIRGMVFLITVLKPFVWLLTWISNHLLALMGVPIKSNDKITNEDIVATVQAGAAAGVLATNEKNAITNVIGLESRLVPSAMTARDYVVYFTLDEDYESIARQIAECPHDKFLVCDKDIDHVIGVVASKDLLTKVIQGKSFSLKDSSSVSPALFVPDSLTLSEMLDLFKDQSADFAVVVNEYALTVGILTMNDLMRSVMGDFVTPTDDAQIVARDDGSWLLDGATPVDDVEQAFGIDRMPDEETYETIAGFIMYMLRKVPKRTDKVDFAGYRFEVLDVENRRINQILVTRLDKLEAAGHAGSKEQEQQRKLDAQRQQAQAAAAAAAKKKEQS